MGVIKGDTRSLDYSSCRERVSKDYIDPTGLSGVEGLENLANFAALCRSHKHI